MNGTAAAALDALAAARDAVNDLDVTTLSHRELLEVMDALESDVRRAPVAQHRILNRLVSEANPCELGAKSFASLLSFRMRISPHDARTRVDSAAALAERQAMTGETLPPQLENTAAAQARGDISAEHIRVIQEFFTALPDAVDMTTRRQAEATLARAACTQDPSGLRKAANRLLAYLHTDGDYSDADRARKRGVTLGNQAADGMSRLTGYLTPEARAVFEPIFAKLAAPGMCNPDDEAPVVAGEPSPDAKAADARTTSQRQHDALVAVGRLALCSETLGRLNGLPVTVIVSTTVQELQAGAGHAVTGGGSLLPMRDLIRIASHAYHYLAVFDQHTSEALYLGRTRRCASPSQRIVLHARDRGCTKPGCTAPGYWCEAHHAVDDWKNGGKTDVSDLTLACPADNRLVENTEWTTRRTARGPTEWIPPPDLDTGHARVNDYHHPERMLVDPEPAEEHDTEGGDDEYLGQTG